MTKYLVVFVALLAVAAYAQDRVVVTVTDFSKGMEPVLGPYVTNDPTKIVYSLNMYSTQPGARQLRFGTSELLDYDSIKTKTTAPIDAMLGFFPVKDSSALIFAAGGKWYSEFTGVGWAGDKFLVWEDTFTSVREIRPYPAGDTVTADYDSVVGEGTRFVRDVQPGDSIFVNDTGRQVLYVVSDTRLIVKDTFTTTEGELAYRLSRGYPDSSNGSPFFLQHGDMVYTGSPYSYPQVIYSYNDTMRIRSLGIVDSFRIDNVQTLLNDPLTGIRTYDSIPGTFNKYTHQISLVSRHANWTSNQWFDDANEGAQAYYVTVGHDQPQGTGFKYKTRHYAIDGNTDTAILLRAWYVDTLLGGSKEWRDSIFFDTLSLFTPTLKDTLHDTIVEGTWGYIRSAVGGYQTVIEDSATPSVTLMGRGAVWMLTGADAALIPPDSFYNGMYYLHLTSDDVSFPSTNITPRGAFRFYTYTQTWEWLQPEPPLWTPPGNDSLVQKDGGNPSAWECVLQVGITCYRKQRKYDVIAAYQRLAPEFPSLIEGWYPVRYAVLDTAGTDRLWIVTGTSEGIMDSTVRTTANWELVRVGMPMWSGMESYGYQLVGWGDRNAVSTVSFSASGNPWDWPVGNDASIGADPSDPLVGAHAYNDELVLFKQHSMIGWPGATELSQSDGLVGPRAIVGLNKYLYWLDVDGVKRMQRRDFSGYSIEKISGDIDPVLNSWAQGYYGSDVVPLRIEPQYRHKSVLVHNQRDQHLYLFIPVDTVGGGKNTRCLTYSLESGKWDGIFTLRASDAFWAAVRDTSRIVMGSPDSALITGLDYIFNDATHAPINADLKSGKFWIADSDGWPIESRLAEVRTLTRSSSNAVDSVKVKVIGDSNTDTFGLTYSSQLKVYEENFWSTKNNISKYWQWEFLIYGDSIASMFTPHQFQMTFIPVRRNK